MLSPLPILSFASYASKPPRIKTTFFSFLAPKTQTFAVVGGTALDEKVGQVWWDHLIALLTSHFKENRYTDGLIAAIDRAGQALKTHFPPLLPTAQSEGHHRRVTWISLPYDREAFLDFSYQ